MEKMLIFKNAKRIGLNFYWCFADISNVTKRQTSQAIWSQSLWPVDDRWQGYPTNGYAEHPGLFFFLRGWAFSLCRRWLFMKLLLYFGIFSVCARCYPFYTFVLLWGVVWIIFIALCWDMSVELLRIRAKQKAEWRVQAWNPRGFTFEG